MTLNWHDEKGGPGPGTIFVNGTDSKRGFTFIWTFLGLGFGLYDREHSDGTFKVGRIDAKGRYRRPLPGVVIGFIYFQPTYKVHQ